jgi:hypothetical protein
MAATRSLLTALCCAAAITSLSSVRVSAHHSFFTFTHAVEVPGNVILPPGRYEFRVIQQGDDRRLVEIRDTRTNHWFATLLAVRAEQAGPSARSQVRFLDRANQIAALLFWWDDDSPTGFEFVYPSAQAGRLARASGASLATTAGPMLTPAELRSARVIRVDPPLEPVGTSGAQTALPDVAAEAGRH